MSLRPSAAASLGAPPESPTSEAFQVLRAMAKGHSGGFSGDALARKAIAVCPGGDFAVQRAALEALLRRVAAMRRDKLRVQRQGAVAGRFRVTRADGPAYAVVLTSAERLEGSCACPDFTKSSLGVCKHILAVAALGKGPSGFASAPGPRLEWDPVRPLEGAGDWLARVSLAPGPRGRPSLVEARVRRWLAAGSSAFSGRPAKRLQLVEDLLAFIEGEPRFQPPALAGLLREERARLQRGLANQSLLADLPRLLKGLKHKLYPYQLEGVRRFLGTGRLLLADDMGLGKTIQAVAAAHVLFEAGRIEKGLIIAPASLKPQWIREWQEFSGVPITPVDGRPEDRARIYRRCAKGFLVANYEQVLRDLPLMQRFAADLIVLDEAQRIKNWATKTSLLVKRLDPELRLVLTGTPMENRLDELASLMDWVDEHALEPKWRLAPWHSTLADGRFEVVGARHLETLRTRLSGSMLRRVRKDVLAQLPPRTDTHLPVPLTAEQLERHDELNEPIARLVSTAHRRPLTQPEFLRLMSLFTTQRIICNGLGQLQFAETWDTLSASPRPTEALLASLCSPKLLELRELIANVAVTQERKVVVFSQWRRMLLLARWAVSDVLERAGVRSLFFTGAESQSRRTQNLVDFHDDPSARVLFATDAGGVGLNLQRAASCCVNLEVPWNPAVLEQRIGRIYRLGQSSPVEVYQLVSDGGIEARIASLVKDKKSFFAGLFDGTTDEVAFERSGSFLSKLERIVAPGPVATMRPPAQETAASEDDAGPAEAENTDELPAVPVASAGSAAAVRELFGSMRISALSDGRVRFEAPKEAAAALGAIFEGMAKLLASSAPVSPRG